VLYGIEKDLAISYIIRNLGGHSMPSLPVLRQRKDQIEQAVFNTLFFAVETCY
jgi:nitrogen-specific signal transduction histidine kinase